MKRQQIDQNIMGDMAQIQNIHFSLSGYFIDNSAAVQIRFAFPNGPIKPK
jgi:hypothetical protein